MTIEDFDAAVAAGRSLPVESGPLLRALWHDAVGDWDAAHRLVQDIESPDGAWVHAYLHRREGDIGNAHYWYRHANRPPEKSDLDAERRAIVADLLARP
jgi:hypothetical protein